MTTLSYLVTPLKKVNFRDDRGSATIEFVALSLPILVPFALYLTSINSSAQLAYEAHSLARQLSRTFVTSPSAEFVQARLNFVMSAHTYPHNMQANYSYSCSAAPCFSNGNAITITVEMTRGIDHVVASDTQIIGKWQTTL